MLWVLVVFLVICGALVWFALYFKGDVCAVITCASGTFKLEAKDRTGGAKNEDS